MRDFLKKIFYWNAPEYGALFGTVLFLPGSWLLLAWMILLGGIPAVNSGALQKYSSWVWCIGGVVELLLFVCLLVNGIRFGKLYRKEMSFARRWKWQIPATACWILLAVVAIMMLSCIGGGCDAVMSEKMIWLTASTVPIMSAGIFCTAKIISVAVQTPWYKLFGRGISVLAVLFAAACAACFLI